MRNVAAGFTQSITDRVFNVLWHVSLLDFVNLPQNLLHDENEFYRTSKPAEFDENLSRILEKPSKGVVVFSLGTVSNTTNMPQQMIVRIRSSGLFRDYATTRSYGEWRVDGVDSMEHVHLLRWLPQKDIMKWPNMKLLIAHGGYNSLLETAQVGVPAVLMPLFADQKINAMRAQRFGIARVLDKLNLTPDIVYEAVNDVLTDEKCV
ncbi:unnamed protein product [Nippostrongylus brasiliensis]|uniref:UDP-glucuronosyltransferase n=1 Tax=Nippostrongylus brasiliensis TaxID=27835 RepID=A0A158QWM7_NIPBR|nr:unnamed protein product [Nippostrongylus brasiliensis]